MKILQTNQIDYKVLADLIGDDPFQATYNIARLSLARAVEMLMCKRGKPLRLEAFQQVILRMLWNKKYPMVIMTRGGSKTFLIAVYAILRAFFEQGSRIVLVGSGFRQGKFIFAYIQELIDSSPLLQEALRKWHGAQAGVRYATDKITLKVGASEITSIPIGDGSKIRGLRATHLIADETASIDEKVFDIAIAPFLSVHADPALNAATVALIKKLEKINADPKIIARIRAELSGGNQLVMCGTASFEFNHFYRRFVSYKMMIDSQGDIVQIRKAIEAQNPDPMHPVVITEREMKSYQANWDQYCIAKIPYYALPEGFMDEALIASSKAQMNPIIFGQEYEAEFARDSFGFYPRSLIHSATLSKDDVNSSCFEIYGDPNAQYVLGLDPARHNDNFGLVVLKLENGIAKLVYCDAWRKTDYPKSVEKIRDVLRRFPNIIKIAMDVGGGGYAVRDLLVNKDILKGDEQPIIEVDQNGEVVDENHKRIKGLRILEMVNFQTWSAPANHQMLADITTKKLVFPYALDEDEVISRVNQYLKGAQDVNQIRNFLYGDLDLSDILKRDIEVGVIANVNACIDEICNIVRSVTPKGVESFELPNISDQAEGLDIRRRDRYSALLLAAYAARAIRGSGHDTKIKLNTYGGIASEIARNSRSNNPMRYHNGVWH